MLSRLQKKELSLAVMLLVVVVVFFFCNVLAFILNVLELFHIFVNELTILNNFLVTVNSSVNFIIYCIFGQKFRRSFLKLLCCGTVPQMLAGEVTQVEGGLRPANNSTYGDRMSYSVGRNTQIIRMSTYNGNKSHATQQENNDPLIHNSNKESSRARPNSIIEENVMLENPVMEEDEDDLDVGTKNLLVKKN